MLLDEAKRNTIHEGVKRALYPCKVFFRDCKESLIDEANNNIRAYYAIFALGAFNLFDGISVQSRSMINDGVPYILCASVPIIYRIMNKKINK